ncbi:hypothetical protein [Ottowia sp.]|uniref:hypothetical protein n=1 Tax=Ottowia sp. TaxID=1898956 RepID=UPI0039E45422
MSEPVADRRGLHPAWLLLLLPNGYFLISQIVGLIPVNGGAGWDGSVYLDYLDRLLRGQQVENSPYRWMRLPGFAPAALAMHLGVGMEDIPRLQSIVNAAVLSGAAALYYATLRKQIGSPAVALCATGVLFLSWPYLVVPVFYPLLSDHLALALAVVSLWAWFDGHRKVLYGVGFFSVWVMPGLFLVPLALACLPFDAGGRAFQPAWRWPVFLLLSALAVFACWPLLGLRDEEILRHPPGTTLGFVELKHWSIGFVLVGMVVIAALWTRLLSSPDFWRRLAWRPLAASSALIGLGFLSTFLVTDWSEGLRGPDLVASLYLQAVAAPAKPLVAHVVYFGPVFLVGLGLCLRPGRAGLAPRSFPLGAVATAALPILLMGSESRQWLYFFPVIVTLVALNERSSARWRLLLGVSIALCLPSVTLGSALIARATERGEPGLGWWWYLAHHGPWMSAGAYLAGAVFAAVFAAAYYGRWPRFGD